MAFTRSFLRKILPKAYCWIANHLSFMLMQWKCESLALGGWSLRKGCGTCYLSCSTPCCIPYRTTGKIQSSTAVKPPKVTSSSVSCFSTWMHFPASPPLEIFKLALFLLPLVADALGRGENPQLGHISPYSHSKILFVFLSFYLDFWAFRSFASHPGRCILLHWETLFSIFMPTVTARMECVPKWFFVLDMPVFANMQIIDRASGICIKSEK